MELNEFVAGFAEQFDETDPSEIKAETVYKDLNEWCSLIAMTVIAFVKTECDKAITGAEIKNCRTVEDLYNLVMSK